MSKKDSYLQPVYARQNIDLSDHTIQEIMHKHPLQPGNNSDNCGPENSENKTSWQFINKKWKTCLRSL